MIRYDLIVKKVDGCASARVEKHEVGSFVKYVDVVERITELEKGLDFTYEKAIKDIKAHNLRQQAKGVERVLCENSLSLVKRERMVLKRIMKQLHEKANALKEQA